MEWGSFLLPSYISPRATSHGQCIIWICHGRVDGFGSLLWAVDPWPECLSQLCRVEDYGRYFSIPYFLASFEQVAQIMIAIWLLLLALNVRDYTVGLGHLWVDAFQSGNNERDLFFR